MMGHRLFLASARYLFRLAEEWCGGEVRPGQDFVVMEDGNLSFGFIAFGLPC